MSALDARGCRVTGADHGRRCALSKRALAAVPGLALRRRGGARAGAAGSARLRDGARAAGLPAAVQPRSAARPLGGAGAGARRRAAGDPPRAPARRRDRGACSPTTTRARRRSSASCCAMSRVDALALQVAHALRLPDRRSARHEGARRRGAAGLVEDRPGCHAVLAMHAFALEEMRRPTGAEQSARAALALEPADARAHHVMAHVFEMTAASRRPACAGCAITSTRWAERHRRRDARLVARRAVPSGAGRPRRRARAVRPAPGGRRAPSDIADLIDASALLWRIQLPAATPGRAGSLSPRPGRRTSTTPSAASTTCMRCWPSSVPATGAARDRLEAPCGAASRCRPATARRRACSACPLAGR